jgi:hypothetical protein
MRALPVLALPTTVLPRSKDQAGVSRRCLGIASRHPFRQVPSERAARNSATKPLGAGNPGIMLQQLGLG